MDQFLRPCPAHLKGESERPKEMIDSFDDAFAVIGSGAGCSVCIFGDRHPFIRLSLESSAGPQALRRSRGAAHKDEAKAVSWKRTFAHFVMRRNTTMRMLALCGANLSHFEECASGRKAE